MKLSVRLNVTRNNDIYAYLLKKLENSVFNNDRSEGRLNVKMRTLDTLQFEENERTEESTGEG